MGAFGENFTIAGLTETDVCIGDVWQLRGRSSKCLNRDSRAGNWPAAGKSRIYPARVVETGRTGWYLRVLQEGIVSPGLSLTLIERGFPQWNVARAKSCHASRQEKSGIGVALAALPCLAQSWKETLLARASSQPTTGPS